MHSLSARWEQPFFASIWSWKIFKIAEHPMYTYTWECPLELLFPFWTTVLSHWPCSQFHPNAGFKEVCVSTCNCLSLFLSTESTYYVLCASHRSFVTALQKGFGNRNQADYDGTSQKKIQVALVFAHTHSKNLLSWWNRIDKFSNKLVFC